MISSNPLTYRGVLGAFVHQRVVLVVLEGRPAPDRRAQQQRRLHGRELPAQLPVCGLRLSVQSRALQPRLLGSDLCCLSRQIRGAHFEGVFFRDT